MHWFPRFVNNLTLYDLTSGWIPCAALLIGLSHYLHSHTCTEHGCYRPVKHSSPYCKKHHDNHIRQ
jgi:hypothetical protein